MGSDGAASASARRESRARQRVGAWWPWRRWPHGGNVGAGARPASDTSCHHRQRVHPSSYLHHFYTQRYLGALRKGGHFPHSPSPPYLFRLRGTWHVGGMQEDTVSTTSRQAVRRGCTGHGQLEGCWKRRIGLVRRACLALAGKRSRSVRLRNVAWTKPGSLHSVRSHQCPNGSRGHVGPAASWLPIRRGTPPTPPFLPSRACAPSIGCRPRGLPSRF